MTTTAVNGAHIYRSLFRELSKQYRLAATKHLSKEASKQKLIAAYRKNKSLKAAETEVSRPRYDSSSLRIMFSTVQNNPYLASEVLAFLKAQHTYKHLLELYNGSTIDEDDKLKLSAKRVGLELPDA